MKARRMIIVAVVALLLSAHAAHAQYSATKDGDVVRLADEKSDTVVSIVPSIGAVIFEMKVRGA